MRDPEISGTSRRRIEREGARGGEAISRSLEAPVPNGLEKGRPRERLLGRDNRLLPALERDGRSPFFRGYVSLVAGVPQVPPIVWQQLT